MRNWLLKTRLFKWAYRQGGIDSFALAQKDILETMRDDLEKQSEELAEQKLADLLSNFDPKHIISFDSKRGLVFIGGEQADEGRLMNLKQEATALEGFELWKILYESPKALAEKAMFVDDGKLETQLLKGRAMLFLLSTQKKILDIINSYSPKKT